MRSWVVRGTLALASSRTAETSGVFYRRQANAQAQDAAAPSALRSGFAFAFACVPSRERDTPPRPFGLCGGKTLVVGFSSTYFFYPEILFVNRAGGRGRKERAVRASLPEPVSEGGRGRTARTTPRRASAPPDAFPRSRPSKGSRILRPAKYPERSGGRGHSARTMSTRRASGGGRAGHVG